MSCIGKGDSMRWLVVQRWWTLVVIAVLAGCASPTPPSPQPTSAPAPTPAPAAAPTAASANAAPATGAAPAPAAQPTPQSTAPASASGFSQQWDDLAAKAKAEGELVAILGPDTVDAERE